MSVDLTGKQKRFLRGLAHHRKAVVWVGDAGLSTAVIAKVAVELENHELIKVKVAEGAPLSAKDAAPILAERTDSANVQIIGRVVVLYKAREEDPEIKVPKD